MSPADALAETEQMTATSVSAALSAMKPWQAAEILQVSQKSDSSTMFAKLKYN